MQIIFFKILRNFTNKRKTCIFIDEVSFTNNIYPLYEYSKKNTNLRVLKTLPL